MTKQQMRIRFAAALMMFGLWFPASLPAQGGPPRDSLTAALLNLVFDRQPELAARRAAVAMAEARYRAAGPVEAPAVGFEIENIPDGVNLADAGQIRLVVEREFLTGSRRAADRALAQAAWDAAAVRLELAERSIGAVLSADLAVWLGGREVAARLAAEDTLLQDTEASLEARFAAGDARYVDVLRIRSERLRARSERADALLGSQEARRQLEGLIAAGDSGVPALQALLERFVELPPRITGEALPLPPDVDSLVAALGTLRLGALEVAGARARADEVRASRSARLFGAIGVQRYGDTTDGFTVGPSLRAAVTLPFAVGGSTRALNQAAALGVVEAQQHQAAATNQLRTALLTARDRYVVALERIQVYGDALLLGAREEREAAVAAYRSGQLSLIELLDFERALSRVETGRVRAAIDAHVAYAHLILTAAGFTPTGDALSATEAAND